MGIRYIPSQNAKTIDLSGMQKLVEFSSRTENQGVHVEFSVHLQSPPNTYSYIREENSDSSRIHEKKIQIQDNSYKIIFPATRKKLTQLHNCIVH